MAPFTTFWGDYLHGLWITWETTETKGDGTSYASGSLNMKINFQANYRSRMYTFINTGAGDVADGTRTFDYNGTGSGATFTPTNPTWQFYVAWTNPTQTGAGSTKDGVYALHDCTLKAGADPLLDQPFITCGWQTQSSTVIYDIHPTATWDSTPAALDAQADDNVTPTTTDTQMCTEVWRLSATSIACVEMTGSVTKPFSSGEITTDFILDYATYKVHSKFGNISDGADTAFKFDEIDVNFANFLAAETNFAHWGYQAAGLSALGSLFAMLG